MARRSVLNKYLYRGYRYDSEIKLYYLNSRFYNPIVGRFINAAGLIGEKGEISSHNMFAYTSNNPVNRTENSGYKWNWGNIGKVVGTVAGALIGAGYGLLTGKELVGSSGRVFWSKVGPEAAKKFAEGVGGSTIGETFIGRVLSKLPYNGFTKVLWKITSAGYAAGARGTAYYYGPENPGKGSIWISVEKPIIKFLGWVNEIIPTFIP